LSEVDRGFRGWRGEDRGLKRYLNLTLNRNLNLLNGGGEIKIKIKITITIKKETPRYARNWSRHGP
jgi:hypothetical protein